ncbi:MAG: 3-hydroxyacyl-CoA dehydrogenase family protein [Lachnospiraceae bacterium]|nr:3-hydroxyacyl-CoA dehydrogenase family protein [Lachnospiraceae bacterium]MBQ6196027.1 3-hydroxyacyl-CoA dehydrogenase family protein [Lachnospiraceae bacterium]
MKIEKVCVVGSGMMGRQIAMNTAKYGYEVNVTDSNAAVLEDMGKWAENYLAGRVAKGRMTAEEAEGVKGRLYRIGDFAEAVADADLVIEAAFEDEGVKHGIFRDLNQYAPKTAILTTNSSAMVSSTFSPDIEDSSRLANLHYFNPALVMELVEIVRNPQTSDETVAALQEFAKKTGKMPVVVQKELEKFIANRIITAIQNEAFWLVENGYCTVEDVDIACEKGCGHKMGPFRTKDLTGIDRNFLMMQAQYDKTGVKPSGYDLFKKYYDAGRYGRKTGHGFYDYE